MPNLIDRLRPHAQYANYVVRHKWFVYQAGRWTRAPLWRLLIHDWSKLTPAEWTAYVDTFYRDRNAPGVAAAFDAAWLHHQHYNPHHWQHWILRQDDGELKVLDMPHDLIREMVADWMGAGRAITGKWDVASWYHNNIDKIIMSDKTRWEVETLIAAYGVEGAQAQHA